MTSCGSRRPLNVHESHRVASRQIRPQPERETAPAEAAVGLECPIRLDGFPVTQSEEPVLRSFMKLVVLVPKPGTYPAATIDRGSGIVTDPEAVWFRGTPAVDPTTVRWEVYYEGNRYGAENMKLFEERVKHAAGRLSVKYPTVARGLYPPDQFDVVGTYEFSPDWRESRLEVTDEATLTAWLGGPYA
jgi:hypothetical protein